MAITNNHRYTLFGNRAFFVALDGCGDRHIGGRLGGARMKNTKMHNSQTHEHRNKPVTNASDLYMLLLQLNIQQVLPEMQVIEFHPVPPLKNIS